MDPQTAAKLAAGSRLSRYTMSIADPHPEKSPHVFHFTATLKDRAREAADALREVASVLGVSPLSLDYTVKGHPVGA